MRWKALIGAALIIISLSGTVFWELRGRESFLLTPVLTVNADLSRGKKINAADLREIRVPRDGVVRGALRASDASAIIGKEAGCELFVNQQLLLSQFSSKDDGIAAGHSAFSIPSSWICSRSSALRAGDRVSIYAMPEKRYLGSYGVAFVKDASEQEVTGGPEGHVLERRVSSSQISGIEILCRLGDYFEIYDAASSSEEPEGSLLIVMEI